MIAVDQEDDRVVVAFGRAAVTGAADGSFGCLVRVDEAARLAERVESAAGLAEREPPSEPTGRTWLWDVRAAGGRVLLRVTPAPGTADPLRAVVPWGKARYLVKLILRAAQVASEQLTAAGR